MIQIPLQLTLIFLHLHIKAKVIVKKTSDMEMDGEIRTPENLNRNWNIMHQKEDEEATGSTCVEGQVEGTGYSWEPPFVPHLFPPRTRSYPNNTVCALPVEDTACIQLKHASFTNKTQEIYFPTSSANTGAMPGGPNGGVLAPSDFLAAEITSGAKPLGSAYCSTPSKSKCGVSEAESESIFDFKSHSPISNCGSDKTVPNCGCTNFNSTNCGRCDLCSDKDLQKNSLTSGCHRQNNSDNTSNYATCWTDKSSRLTRTCVALLQLLKFLCVISSLELLTVQGKKPILIYPMFSNYNIYILDKYS